MQLRLFWAVSFLMLASFAIQSAEMEKTRASQFGLHGPVAKCVERTTYPPGPGTIEQHSTVTTNFGMDGLMLDTTSSYDGVPGFSRVYSHNEPGPVMEKAAHTFDVDSAGRKTRTRKLPKYELQPDTAIGAIPWEDSELQFAPPSEGSVTTIYDEKDRPKEGEVRDSGGQLVMRIVRSYDDKGRILGDKVAFDRAELPVLPQLEQDPEFSQLNTAQKKTLMNMIGSAFSGGESAFKYDDQGRVIEKRVNRGAFGTELTKTSYNDHGDVSEETIVRTYDSRFSGEFSMDDAGNIVPGSKGDTRPPEETTVRYTYEYDGHGNWTKKTTESRFNPKDEFAITAVAERTLTYY